MFFVWTDFIFLVQRCQPITWYMRYVRVFLFYSWVSLIRLRLTKTHREYQNTFLYFIELINLFFIPLMKSILNHLYKKKIYWISFDSSSPKYTWKDSKVSYKANIKQKSHFKKAINHKIANCYCVSLIILKEAIRMRPRF